MKKFLFIVTANLIVVGIIVLLLQFFYPNIWAPQEYRAIYLKENRPNRSEFIKVAPQWRHIIPHEGVMFEIDENGFVRPGGRHQDPELTVVFQGGSTTECMMVLPEYRFPAVVGRMLEERTGLKVNTWNAGVSGNQTFHNLNIFLNRIRFMKPKPDCVVLMNNHNDLNILLSRGDYDNDNIISVLTGTNIFRYFYKRIGALALFKDVSLVAYKKWLQVTPHDAEAIPSLANPDSRALVLQKYRENLECFIALCRVLDIHLVLMTQPGNFSNENVWFFAHVKSDPEAFKNFCHLFDQANDIMRELGRQEGVSCIDLAAAIPRRDTAFMYDGLHYTDSGSLEVAGVITDFLADQLATIRRAAPETRQESPPATPSPE